MPFMRELTNTFLNGRINPESSQSKLIRYRNFSRAGGRYNVQRMVMISTDSGTPDKHNGSHKAHS